VENITQALAFEIKKATFLPTMKKSFVQDFCRPGCYYLYRKLLNGI